MQSLLVTTRIQKKDSFFNLLTFVSPHDKQAQQKKKQNGKHKKSHTRNMDRIRHKPNTLHRKHHNRNTHQQNNPQNNPLHHSTHHLHIPRIIHPTNTNTIRKSKTPMKKTISFNNIKVKLEQPDLDGDGIIGGTEHIKNKNYNETEIFQQTELGESLKEINKDDIDPKTRMSAIDMRTRLHRIEIPSMIVWDSLIAMRALGSDCMPVSLKKSRYAISLGGEGRKENRDIIIGQREHQAKMSGLQQSVKEGLGLLPKQQ